MSETDLGMLVREAAASGVMLWAEAGQLHYQAAEGGLTNDLRDALRSRKSELIGKLSKPLFKKSSSPPALTRFPECSKGFWEESEANAAFRHSTHFALKLTGKIERQRIESAFQRLSARHDLLRSRIRVADDGMPVLALEDTPPAPVEIVELSGSSAADQPSQVRAALERAIYAPFEDGRTYRAHVIKVSEVEHLVAVVIHHFVADAVTLEVVAGELLAGMLGQQSPQPQSGERPLQYADYLLGQNEWIAGPGLPYRLKIMKDNMRGVQAVQFPPTDTAEASGPSKLEVLDFQVGRTQRAGLADAIALAGVPVSSAILAANFAALYSTLQRRDLFTVFLHMGRSEPVLFDLVGFTVNCFPVRVTVSPNMSYVELMRHVHDAFVFARDHQVPWGILMPLLAEVGAGHVAPLFNYRSLVRDAASAPPMNARRGGFAIEPVSVAGPEPTNSVDWKSYELHATDTGADMRITLKYMPIAYQSAAVQEFSGVFLRCLEALAADPASPLCK